MRLTSSRLCIVEYAGRIWTVGKRPSFADGKQSGEVVEGVWYLLVQQRLAHCVACRMYWSRGCWGWYWRFGHCGEGCSKVPYTNQVAIQTKCAPVPSLVQVVDDREESKSRMRFRIIAGWVEDCREELTDASFLDCSCQSISGSLGHPGLSSDIRISISKCFLLRNAR